ncbi:zinc ribbon domain-containing protein [Nonomuraea sp. NPDC049480]|uniref:zinc ribbon domain-containing protein n=1 Tax=Nonomuraea sp. NPDC049480 TaxID=3364353 RepID=UPI0037A85944
MSRRLPPAAGQSARTACARALLRGGVAEKSGELVSAAVLAERVGWCADLVSAMTAGVLAGHWATCDVALLAGGVDAGGRRLPSQAWMALRRLGWTATAPAGVTVNDRIARMAQEQAGRLLRSAHWRAELTAGVLATWPADPLKRTAGEWDAVRAAIPGGRELPASVIKARTRQVAAFVRAQGRLPADVFELEGVPRAARMLVLAACDRQQATLWRSESDPGRALLRLQVPTRPDPRCYADWTWVACPITLPPTVPADAVLHLPTLRPRDGSVRADIAYTHLVPAARRAGHTIALGVDWGLSTLLTAGAARLHQGGRITALGAGARFRAAGVLAKQHRLRRLGEHLHAKTGHYQRLLDGCAPHPALGGKQARLAEESRRLSARRRHLNDALAWAAARWVVDQAIAAKVTVVYLEDLRSLEAAGMGRSLKTRLSQQVRGQIAGHIRHLAAESGIAVVSVPARNTSKHCPHCLSVLRHRKAPDRPTVAGWKWALCPGCGWQGDRDQGAWRRIAARGLTHQATTVTDRASGAMAIGSVVDQLEARAVITPPTPKTRRTDRSKTGPTRRRTPRPAPRRRRAPSPTRPTRRAGQRPEGHAHTGRTGLPRAAHRHQGVTTISTPTKRHRPRGAALGAGFHLHAHATPPRWAPPTPDATPDIGSLS